MGLAASQARYLSLTSRKSDLELQSQTINSRRLQLSYKTQEIADKYADGMKNEAVMVSSPDGEKWATANFTNALQKGYMVIGLGGRALGGNPYEAASVKKRVFERNGQVITPISQAEYDALSSEEKANFEAVDPNATTKTYKYKGYTAPTAENATNPEQISSAAFAALPAGLRKCYNAVTVETNIKPEDIPAVDTSDYIIDYNINDTYGQTNEDTEVSLQQLLQTGQGMLVSKEFFSFLQSRYSFNIQQGLTPEMFEQAQKEFSLEDAYQGLDTVVDHTADEKARFDLKNNTEDDAKVLAEYTAETAKIQRMDKELEIEEKNIETQHKAIETELENIKKVIQKNIEETFKIFS